MTSKDNKQKALVLLSGGQDSATCLALACSECDEVVTLCIYYGQRHQIEIQQARKIAALANVELLLVDLSFVSTINQNALTDPSKKIEEKKDDLPSTFVPGRNALFLNVAYMMAYEKDIKRIYTGVCQTDYSGYPDCRESFIRSMNQSLNLAMEVEFEICTPLMFLTKSETVLLMKKLGKLEWYKQTHTCYRGLRPACGSCPACKLRLKGFREANIADPLPYIK